MPFILREATQEDAALVADISRQTFYDTFAADNTEADMNKFLDEQFTKGRLMLEVGAQGHTFLLACDGDVVAGYIKLRGGKVPKELANQTALEIARLYVVKEYIGKGVGALLMKAGIAAAGERGKKVIWLCVWEKNQRAIDFYTRWGFEKFGECDFLLGDDRQRDWLMQKTLR